MPNMPDKITNNFLKFVHHTLCFVAIIAALITIGAFNTGGNFVLPALIAAACVWAAANIKYEWKHKASANLYE